MPSAACTASTVYPQAIAASCRPVAAPTKCLHKCDSSGPPFKRNRCNPKRLQTHCYESIVDSSKRRRSADPGTDHERTLPTSTSCSLDLVEPIGGANQAEWSHKWPRQLRQSPRHQQRLHLGKVLRAAITHLSHGEHPGLRSRMVDHVAAVAHREDSRGVGRLERVVHLSSRESGQTPIATIASERLCSLRSEESWTCVPSSIVPETLLMKACAPAETLLLARKVILLPQKNQEIQGHSRPHDNFIAPRDSSPR